MMSPMIDEVARLLAVAEDGDRLASQQLAQEYSQYPLVRVANAWPGPYTLYMRKDVTLSLEARVTRR